MSSQAPILALRNIHLSFGGKPIFSDMTVQIFSNDRICLVGRNGSGKSTLLKILSGDVDFDQGERFLQPGLKIAYLPQDLDLPEDEQILDYICRTTGLPHYEVESMLGFLEMIPDRVMKDLSGGERRRILLAKTLAQNPDILLLDEPTNHLDIPAIEWLENNLRSFQGALVVISHDRAFLKKVSTSTWYVDRGNVLFNAKGYDDFDRWTDALLLEEERQISKLNARLRLEEDWVHRGVTARRKRNQGRLRMVRQMRDERRSRESNRTKNMTIASLVNDAGSKMVIETHNLTKSFEDKVIVKGFTTRILRGDRIGVVGPNGSGKTTLVKLLLKQLPFDEGRVKLGTNVDLIYFDQMRDSLKGTDTLWHTLCPSGGDQVCVGGEFRHVMSYLKGFLFTEAQVRGQVSILSGGEKNRLALAKAFTQPGNLLVLDEPTNDLDMDTLDLLQELLSDFEGTLIIISHDRDFLDKLTTSIIAVEGDGSVQEYVGGYTDYLEQRQPLKKINPPQKIRKNEIEHPTVKSERKITYNDQREYDLLPKKMENLVHEIKTIEEKLDYPDFYQSHPHEFVTLSNRLEEAKSELHQSENRWLELAEKIEG